MVDVKMHETNPIRVPKNRVPEKRAIPFTKPGHGIIVAIT